MVTTLRPGDIVTGPSISDAKSRRWVLLCEPTDGLVIGQNVRAIRPYRHPLDVANLRLTGERDENWQRWKS
jgi:hypothetical protein